MFVLNVMKVQEQANMCLFGWFICTLFQIVVSQPNIRFIPTNSIQMIYKTQYQNSDPCGWFCGAGQM